MTKPIWTPGPWRTNGYVIEGPRMALEIAIVQRAGRKDGLAAKTEDESKANARLIAAAPDLYAAPSAMVEEALSCGVEAEHKAMVDAALDALIKARGEG